MSQSEIAPQVLTRALALGASPAGTLCASKIPPILEDQESLEASAPLGHGPDREETKSRVLDRAYEEYCQLAAAGNRPDAEEFCQRFPHYRSSLFKLIFAHQLFEEELAEDPKVLQRYRLHRCPQVGEEFLGFVLLRQLGDGHFARVFLARQPKLGGRLVVIKVSEEGGALEARVLGPLNHPNIVPILSVAQDEVTLLTLVCMPYLGSTTLEDVLDRAFVNNSQPTSARLILEAAAAGGQDPPPDGEPDPVAQVLKEGSYTEGVVHLGIQLAEALAFIHQRGIYHRDLKPSNVLLNPQGRALLLDFNLSSGAEGGDHDAEETRVGGTLPYMAPEHLRAMGAGNTRADLKAIDGRSDLFALAVILYELLTGRHPFGQFSPQSPRKQFCQEMLKRQAAGPCPLRSLNPGVPRRLAGVIESCLAFDPGDRPQGAGKLADALRRCQTSPPLNQPAEQLVNALRRWPAPSQVPVGRSAPISRDMLMLLVVGAFMLALAAVLSGLAFLPAWEKGPNNPLGPIYTLEQGLDHFNRGEYDQALKHLGPVVEADPGNDGAFLIRGRAYQKQRAYDLALASYMKVKEGHASFGKAQAGMGYCDALFKSFDAANLHFDRALKAGFVTPQVHNNKGYCFLENGKLDQARKCLDEAILGNRCLSAAYHNRALVNLKQRQAGGSLQLLDSAREDIDNALQHTKAPIAAALFLDAARIYAVAARNDQRFTGQVRSHLHNALTAGADPETIMNDLLLPSPVKEELRLRRPLARPWNSQPSAEPVRLIDPLPDSPAPAQIARP